jgi:hypothetical protein
MIIYKYLVISKNGSVKAVEREPRLDANQISLKLMLDVPNEFFERPRLEARLTVPATAVQKSKINLDVVGNVEKLIKEATGLTMAVSIVEQKEEKK